MGMYPDLSRYFSAAPFFSDVRKPYSTADFVLQPCFWMLHVVFSFTIIRLWAVSVLIPAYIFVKLVEVLPWALANSKHLLSFSGPSHLLAASNVIRKHEAGIAEQQLQGTFQFRQGQLQYLGFSGRHKIRSAANWLPNIEKLAVNGATAVVVVEKPDPRDDNGKSIVLLHGNPSWSYMWRDLIPGLVQSGHTVYALDFIGHGLSDKPLTTGRTTVELHIRTILALFNHYNLINENTTVVAHDWAGTIFMSAAPYLVPNPNVPALDGKPLGARSPHDHTASSQPPKLLFLNSALPFSPYGISLSAFSIHALYFLVTGIFGTLLPQSFVIRFLSPLATTAPILRGYSAQYTSLRSRTSFVETARTMPFLPTIFYTKIRQHLYWRYLEGLLGPWHFTNINAQARLAQRSVEVRRYWRKAAEVGWQVGAVSGHQDPLFREYEALTEEVLDPNCSVEVKAVGVKGGWVEGAGRYGVEERMATFQRAIRSFAQHDRPKQDY